MTEQRERFWLEVCAVGFLLLVCLAILVLRNPDPLVNPAMFTEDGSWTEFYFHLGAVQTFLRARPDYYVFGNIALLQAAMAANTVLIGDNIDHLPVFIAVVSFGFYAVSATFTALALRPYMGIGWRLLCVAAVVLLPMGGHMNEILGRVSNVGFAFYVIATLALLLRLSLPRRRFSWSVLALDLLLLFCAFTNPLAALPVLLVAGLGLADRAGRASANTYLLALFGLLSVVSTIAGLDTPLVERGQAVLTLDGLIVAGIARPLLYPFLFPYYEFLTNRIVILMGCGLALYLAVGCWAAKSPLPLAFLLLSLGIVTAATALSRPDLHHYLLGYRLTFPDRYFYAQNVLVLIAFVWATRSLFLRFRRLGVVPVAVLGSVVGVWVKGGTIIFDPVVPAHVIRTGPSFAEQLRAAEPSTVYPGFLAVEIYPPGWPASYPARFGGR